MSEIIVNQLLYSTYDLTIVLYLSLSCSEEHLTVLRLKYFKRNKLLRKTGETNEPYVLPNKNNMVYVFMHTYSLNAFEASPFLGVALKF